MRALAPKPHASIPVLSVLLVVSCLLTSSGGTRDSPAGSGGQAGIRPDQGCTIFYAANDNVALGGNNEDHNNPYTYVWFVPREPGKYGRVYFGYEDGFPQGGTNEVGLFFDGAALPYKALSRPDDRPVYDGAIPRGNLFDKMMAESANVAEALAIFGSYSNIGMDTYQLLLGDAEGDSVIVDGNTVSHGEGPFQIATNFRLSENPEAPFPCWRYTTARERLAEAESFSVELFRDILDATHQEPPGPTLYSNIYDLKNGLIYLYQHHNFQNEVVLDVAAELEEGFHFYRLASLFPADTEIEGFELQIAPDPQLSDRVTSMEANQLDEYAGEYLVGSLGDTVSIYVEENRLYLRQAYSLPIELLSEGGDRFFHVFHDGNEMGIAFQRDGQGAVNGATGAMYGEGFQLDRPQSAQPSPQTLPTLDTPPTTARPVAAPAATNEDQTRGIPFWVWVLAALGVITAAAAAKTTISRGRDRWSGR